MRKLSIEIELNPHLRQVFSFFTEKLETLELLELIKIDFKQGTKLAIAAVTVKDGFAIDEIWGNQFIEMLTVLSQDIATISKIMKKLKTENCTPFQVAGHIIR